jgi:hypothetical protein
MKNGGKKATNDAKLVDMKSQMTLMSLCMWNGYPPIIAPENRRRI